MTQYWDLPSVILYIAMGFIGLLSVKEVKRKELKIGHCITCFNRYYISWALIWVLFATMRYVDTGIGGTDAITYKTYFEICNDSYIPSYYDHYDMLFRLVCKLIRLFTSDYHVFFVIIYIFFLMAYIVFISELCPDNVIITPIFMTVYYYIRGFTTIRTNLSVAMILLGIVMVRRKKYILGFLLAFSTFFVQKASIVYAMVIPFYLLFKTSKVTVKRAVLFTVLATLVSYRVRSIFVVLRSMDIDLGGSYASYASKSIGMSFFDNYWKIAFGQLLLAGAMLIFRKQIQADIRNMGNSHLNQERLNFVWVLCIFDFILIPMTFVLNIWRGYEYLFLPRLIMWGEIIKICRKKFSPGSRKFIDFATYFAFIAWFIFRLYNTFEESSLLPYVLGLFR